MSSNRVVMGGFSQGAAMALLASLTGSAKFAGIVSLSGYVPLAAKISTIAVPENANTPILQCHGTHDQVVPFAWGKQSHELLVKMGRNVDFRAYQGLEHSSSPQEVRDVAAFISRVLP